MLNSERGLPGIKMVRFTLKYSYLKDVTDNIWFTTILDLGLRY